VCEGEGGSEENYAGENRTAQDPRGADLNLHDGTFLTAMIASWTEENEITQVQSQKDISEVQQPLCFSLTSELRTATMRRSRDLAEQRSPVTREDA
jgi:hypothetical protein